MRPHTAKQEALKAIQRMPDDAGLEEIMYRLYVLENVRHGREDASNGLSQDAQEVLKDIPSW